MGKLFGALIVLVAIIGGCGILYGRVVRTSPQPQYVLVQPSNAELGITQPLTQTIQASVTLTPVEDDREARAQVIWRFTFVAALVLILAFLAAAVLISWSV